MKLPTSPHIAQAMSVLICLFSQSIEIKLLPILTRSTISFIKRQAGNTCWLTVVAHCL